MYLHKINKNTIKKYLIQKLKSKKRFHNTHAPANYGIFALVKRLYGETLIIFIGRNLMYHIEAT